MSQIQKAGKPSIGEPSERIIIKWDEFIQFVLKLTLRAYKKMRQDQHIQKNWEENTFTIKLVNHLRPIASEVSILVEPFRKEITVEMEDGKQSVKEANEIDLSLFGNWRDYDKKHFVWEAKRVGDKRIDNKYSRLNSEYVNKAIYRFIKLKYAIGLNDAGILGYVLAGNPATIVNDINQTMGRIRKNKPLPQSNHLKNTDPLNDFEDVYRSQHTRTDSTKIELHHLFLSFDFVD